MIAYIRGLKVFTDCRGAAVYELQGLRDKTIYATLDAEVNMSPEFHNECKNRNLKIEVIDNS